MDRGGRSKHDGVVPGMESYRLERIAIWKNPEAYEKGYQTIQGLYAIGSGGLFGRGFGESIQKLDSCRRHRMI